MRSAAYHCRRISPPRVLDASPAVRSKSRRRVEWLINASEMAGDFCAAAAALMSAYGMYHFSHLGRHVVYSRIAVLEVAALFAVISVWFLERNGAYRSDSSLLRVKEPSASCAPRHKRSSRPSASLSSPVTWYPAGSLFWPSCLVPIPDSRKARDALDCPRPSRPRLRTSPRRHLWRWTHGTANLLCAVPLSETRTRPHRIC